MTDGQYSFSIALDDKELKLGAAAAKRAFAELVEAARKAGVEIDESFENPFDNLDTATAEKAFADFVKKAQEAGVKVEEVFEKVFESIPQQMPENPFTAITPPANLPQQTMAATQSFNGLNMATQSLVRELPAATMGLNTYFLAISNNLPIFADQIKQMNAANEQLRAQGKPTVSVIKQIIGSLFSWQTALTVGITVLSMYGKEIGNWIASLFKGKEAVDSMADAQKGLSEAIQKDGLGIGSNIVKLQQLSREYRSLGDNMNARKQFILDNKSAFDDLGVSIRNVADADGLFIERTPEFIQAMKLRAQASAAQRLAQEQYEKLSQGEIALSELEKQYAATPKMTNDVSQTWVDADGRVHTTYGSRKTDEALRLEQEINQRRQENAAIQQLADSYFDLGEAYTLQANSRLKAAGFTPSGGGGTSGSSAAANAAEAERKRLKEMQEQLAKDAEDARTDATITAMDEGLEKEKAAINANYDEKAQLINEREEELKKMQKGALTEQQVADFQALRDRNEQLRNEEIKAAEDAAEKAKKTEDAKTAAAEQSWNEYLIAYGTFQERLKATQDKYAAEIANAKNDGEKKMLEAERDAILAEFAVEAEGFGRELVGKTTEELSKMIEQLRAQVEAKQQAFDALDSSDSTSAQAYREEINKLNAQIKVLQGLLGKAKKEVKDDNWADATQVFQNISQAANDAAEGLAEFDEGAANILRTMGQLAGTAINLIGAIQAVATAANAAAGTISAMEKASIILAVIGAAIQAASVLINLFKGSDEVEQTMRQFKELNTELERFRKLAQIDSVEGTIFGEDAFGNFSNNLRVMREASEELKTTHSSFGDIYESQMAYFEKLLAQYQAIGDTVGEKVIQGKIDELKAQGESYQAVLGSFIVGGSGGQTLADLYPELFAGGEVTLEGLQNLKESDVWEKLSQENRDLIDELIANWERYDEATKAVTDYLTNIFGELGQEINDAIVDAFANGTDAAVAFGDVAGKMLENLISQIGYTAYIAPILSKAMQDVEALNGQDLSAEDYLNALMGIVGDTMKAAEDAVDGYNEFLERSDRMAEEQGINTFNGERTAAAKGIAQASQDSVDELNGRMTAMQSHTSMLVDGQKQLINDSAQALTYLAGIESNTAHLEQMRYDMGAMHKDMSAMRKDISDMATRGIVTR